MIGTTIHCLLTVLFLYIPRFVPFVAVNGSRDDTGRICADSCSTPMPITIVAPPADSSTDRQTLSPCDSSAAQITLSRLVYIRRLVAVLSVIILSVSYSSPG